MTPNIPHTDGRDCRNDGRAAECAGSLATTVKKSGGRGPAQTARQVASRRLRRCQQRHIAAWRLASAAAGTPRYTLLRDAVYTLQREVERLRAEYRRVSGLEGGQ